jgi:hypothetical protein
LVPRHLSPERNPGAVETGHTEGPLGIRLGYERRVSEGSAVNLGFGCRHAPLSLGVDGLASGEHGDELLDSPLAGLSTLGRGYAVKDRVAVCGV